MVRPYYTTMRMQKVLGQPTPPLPPHTTWYPALECYCSQIAFLGRFEAVVAKSQRFSCSRYAWEWGITVCVLYCLCHHNGTCIHVRSIACERSSPKLTLWQKLSSGEKVFFSPTPTEILWMTAVTSVATFRATIERPTKVHTVFLRRLVG